MIFALVHYPDVDIRRIQAFRKKYDPQADLIAPHITVLFPVPESVGEENLGDHLDRVLRQWQPFPIRLYGIQRSVDDYVYLLVQEGKEKLVRLYDALYTGPVSDFRCPTLSYIPHVTLGIVGNHPRILEEAVQLGINDYCRLDRLHLVKVDRDRSQMIWSREFRLADPGE